MGWFSSKQEKLNNRLRRACSAGKLAEIEHLLAIGADINTKDVDGNPPLVYAIQRGRAEAVQLLISMGADVNPIDGSLVTPLMNACWFGKESIIKPLLQAGADVNARNSIIGWTALHYVTVYCDEETLIPMLAKKGADINARTEDGETALHKAANRGKFHFVKTLLENGADADARDNKGNRPEELARRSSYNGVANFLHEKTTPTPVAAEVTAGWKLTAEDEIAFASEKTATGYCLTEIFNFNSRIYTQIARNLKTNAESQSVRFFDEFPDKKILEQAHQQLLKQGGKADQGSIYRAVLNK
jgi:ankyrin repeat protein